MINICGNTINSNGDNKNTDSCMFLEDGIKIVDSNNILKYNLKWKDLTSVGEMKNMFYSSVLCNIVLVFFLIPKLL